MFAKIQGRFQYSPAALQLVPAKLVATASWKFGLTWTGPDARKLGASPTCTLVVVVAEAVVGKCVQTISDSAGTFVRGGTGNEEIRGVALARGFKPCVWQTWQSLLRVTLQKESGQSDLERNQNRQHAPLRYPAQKHGLPWPSAAVAQPSPLSSPALRCWRLP